MTELITTFGLPLLACLLMTVILSYLGLHVLKREIIFIDIAVAQTAALGVIIAHLFFHIHADEPLASVFAFGSTLITALFFAVIRRKITTLPIEATIGITYAIVSAGALFIIGKSNSGHSHIQQMLSGSLLWVNAGDIVWSTIAFAFAGICFRLCDRQFQKVSDNYEKAAASGMNVVGLDFLFYALCGIVITAAVRIAGVVVVFCFLIIPATISAMFSSRSGIRLIIAWTAGILSSLCGFIFCAALDFSAGVSVSLMLCLVLIVLSALKLFTSQMSITKKKLLISKKYLKTENEG